MTKINLEKTPMYLSIACPLPIKKTFDYLLPKEFDHLTDDELLGRRVEVSFGPRKQVGVIVESKLQSDADPAKLKPISKILDTEPLLTPDLIVFAQWLSRRYLCSWGEALFALMPPGRGNPTSFKDPGEGVHHDFIAHPEDESAFQLTADQETVRKRFHEAIYSHQKKSFLLFGVAAAGKTEMYASAINDALSQGKNALVLTPEIGLAYQTADYLKERFGDKNVLLWHSDQSLKDRVQNWWRMKRNEYHIVVGSRSAALAPLPNLGVIIVDEEQDSAYKEDRKPRFHAREAALFRAKMSEAVAIFGTATPSLEILDWVERGELELAQIKERAIRSSAPRVRLINLKEEKTRGVFSPTLEKEIKNRLGKNEQVILFLNKRGFHRFLKCPECAWVARCADCDIAVVEHKGAQAAPPRKTDKKKDSTPPLGGFVCHYCGKPQTPPPQCPECGHKKLFAGGFGTQRVVEDIKKRFPSARVARWDRDAVGKVGDQKKIYEEFLNGEDDILVGTQMVAQGFNFPRVTLVGVLDADGPLYLPDFRAAEKTFHLLTQVAGRAGRAMVTGDVLIQTRNPDHYALQYAQAMDLFGFAKEERTFREEFRYPPFSQLVLVRTLSSKPTQAEKDATAIADWAADLPLSDPVGLLGPMLSKRQKKGKLQYQVLFKVSPADFEAFEESLGAFLGGKSNRYQITVDPEGIF